jgi:hypothetical protein
MRLEEARAFIWQALRQTGWNQVSSLFMIVGDLKAQEQGIDRRHSYDGRAFLNTGDQSILLEVIWSLIVQGVLVPGLDDANQSWPFVRLTKYGEQCVAENRILPHDPDSYIAELISSVPDADPTIVEYVTESLQCYIHGLYRAGAVMLGGASEKAILILVETYLNSIDDSTARERFAREYQKTQSIFRKYELFDRQFDAIKSRMPRSTVENIDSLLRGVFDLIRSSRNDAGHPASGIPVDQDVLYSHLRLFVPYCERIYCLVHWFQANRT